MMRFTFKKLLSITLSLVLILGLVTVMPLTAMGAGQTPSSWAADSVNRAIELDIVPEQFKLDYGKVATRAEFCALAVALYEKITGEEINDRLTFADTKDVNVEKAAAIGVVNGTGNNNFSPNSQLSREQAATMLARLAEALNKPLAKQEPAFSDNKSISTWAFESVGQVQVTGVMGGVGNNNFQPKGPYTREQCIITIVRIYNSIVNTASEGINYKAWALGCSAILATRNGYEPYQFGMFTKNDTNAGRAKNLLSQSWGCSSREDLIETIEYMTDNGHNSSFAEAYGIATSLSDSDYQTLLELSGDVDRYMWPLTKSLGDKWGDKQLKAWDWFRMIHLAGWGYVAGYLELQEAYDYMTPVIERLRSTFSSWEEANENYMDGYAWWSRTEVSKSGTEYKRRLQIYKAILDYPLEKNLFDPTVWK